MGNENSKKKGPIKDGKNGEKHLNGKVNSLKVKNKSDKNGATIEKAEMPNGELTTNTKNKESIVETDGFNVEAPVNGSKDIPGISTEAQVISPKNVPTIQKQQTDEAKGVLKDDEEAPSSQQPEQADTAKNQDSETLEEPKSVTLDLKLVAGQTDNDDQKSQPEEKKEESDQNPVMNFFKTLVTPTKSQKKETATPDVTKDQPLKETPPTVTSTTVAQVPEPPAAAKGMSIPPPPPPELPKMEIKGGPAAQQQKPTPKEGAKASAKQPDAAKGKSAKETLSSFFRSKKADASKTTTLEADVKPQAAAPLPEDKKPAAKSPFFSFFKPKSQKRNSLDAGVQTESAAAAPASEKTK
ncbi:unnamed protein product [Arctogadus glacialis]